ncbi:hypothetical protein V9T40_011775 [Parthenolecanium corni]|uniref:Uncharacterized protein n=1 Tax=Parthenolecanium corni TaxID=536013 RepID=A0AAN9T9I7_9HEMI
MRRDACLVSGRSSKVSYLLDVTLQDVAAIVVYIRFRPGNEVTATAAEVPAVELEKFVAPSNSGRCPNHKTIPFGLSPHIDVTHIRTYIATCDPSVSSIASFAVRDLHPRLRPTTVVVSISICDAIRLLDGPRFFSDIALQRFVLEVTIYPIMAGSRVSRIKYNTRVKPVTESLKPRVKEARKLANQSFSAVLWKLEMDVVQLCVK